MKKNYNIFLINHHLILINIIFSLGVYPDLKQKPNEFFEQISNFLNYFRIFGTIFKFFEKYEKFSKFIQRHY